MSNVTTHDEPWTAWANSREFTKVALNLVFADKQAQDDYQVHPEHLKFIAEFSKLWKRVTVYDFA